MKSWNQKTAQIQSTTTGPKNRIPKTILRQKIEPHDGPNFFGKIIICSTSPTFDKQAQKLLEFGRIKNQFWRHKIGTPKTG